MKITATKWILTASENVETEFKPHTYTFDVYVFPSGEAMVPGSTSSDAWHTSLDDVQPNGNDILTKSEETGHTQEFSLEEIKESVRQSCREYGACAIPESLGFFLKKADRA
jgi:hypothetical protein